MPPVVPIYGALHFCLIGLAQQTILPSKHFPFSEQLFLFLQLHIDFMEDGFLSIGDLLVSYNWLCFLLFILVFFCTLVAYFHVITVDDFGEFMCAL